MKSIYYSIAALFLCAYTLSAEAENYPSWWIDREVIDADPVGNKSAINQGQLLHLAKQAIAELEVQLAPAGGAQIDFDSFLNTDDSSFYSPVNLGQLKHVSSQFYDRFAEIGFNENSVGWPKQMSLYQSSLNPLNRYPWPSDITPANLNPSTIGQAKFLFSWDLSADSDLDDIPDWWELYAFGYLNLALGVDKQDMDGDGVSDADEFRLGLNPASSASNDGDGIPDDWEMFWFTNTTTANDASANNDDDLFTDAQEYAMGTDPTGKTVLSVTLVSGDGQIVMPGSLTPEPLLVRVTENLEDPLTSRVISNAPVTFTIEAGSKALSRVVPHSQPLHVVRSSDAESYSASISVQTDLDGIARLDFQVHALAPTTPGAHTSIRSYVAGADVDHDFTVYANRAPTDIIFKNPSDPHNNSSNLFAIDLSDTTEAGSVLAILDFSDLDTTMGGSFEIGNYTDLFTVVRVDDTWELRTAADSNFKELFNTKYGLDLTVTDAHGGNFSETIQITVSDADPNDSPVLAAPKVNVEGGSFHEEQIITLTNENDTGLIFYTLDGSDPKIGGQLYTPGTTIVLAQNFQGDGYETIQLRAVVRDNNTEDSAELYEEYVFKPSGKVDEVYIYATGDVINGIGQMTLTYRDNSTSSPKARLGYGWIVNDNYFVPDCSKDSEEIYVIYYDPNGYSGVDSEPGNERYILAALGERANFWASTRKMPIGRGWVQDPGGHNVIVYGSGVFENFTGSFIPDPDPASHEPIYAGVKDFSRGGSQRHSQTVLTTDKTYLDYGHVSMGSGTIENPVGSFQQLSFTPTPGLSSQPVYFGLNSFKHENSSITNTFDYWVYSYVENEISEGAVKLSNGWIHGAGGTAISSDPYVPDFGEPAVELYGGLKWVEKSANSNLVNYSVEYGNRAPLKTVGWLAYSASVGNFGQDYREHSLGKGWTTGPFSYQPKIDPAWAKTDPDLAEIDDESAPDIVRYRRRTWNSAAPAESTEQDGMDYLIISRDTTTVNDYYTSSTTGWSYREKNVNIEMSTLGGQDEFIAEGYDKHFFISSLDPIFSQDSDRDGIADGFETFSYHTDPYLADSDGDLIPDGIEIDQSDSGLDPLVKNDALAVGYIEDVALLGQQVSLPDQAEAVQPQVLQVNSGHPSNYGVVQPPQVITGARYRKIGLNGFPLPDEQPQAESEDDEDPEETYIDAFNLSLNHSVTDVYVPLPGSSDLALQVRRNFNGEIWDSDNGSRPDERLDRPFGAGWSSNLCSFLKITLFPEDPAQFTVQDESGVSHRFLHQGGSRFLAIPSGRNQQDALLNTLTSDGTNFIFTKKHGTTITFESDRFYDVPSRSNRGSSDSISHRDTYHRASDVTDRHGNRLVYSYTMPATDTHHEDEADLRNATASLIPESITFTGRGTETQSIEITADRRNVISIKDPRRHEIYYDYSSRNGGVVDSYPLTYPITVLDRVEFATSNLGREDDNYEGHATTYTYDLAGEVSYSFYGGNIKSHLNLETISDANQNTYRFYYDFDRTNRVSGGKHTFTSATTWFVQNGYPRQVVRVDLPGSGSSARFEHSGLSQYIHDVSPISALWMNYLSGYRATLVTDAENNAHVYNFGQIQVERLNDPYQVASEDPRMMYYLEMEISHYQGGSVSLEAPDLTLPESGEPAQFVDSDAKVLVTITDSRTELLGSETYNFSIESGLQLASVSSFSLVDSTRNITDFVYDKDFVVNANFFIPNQENGENLNPYFNSDSGYALKFPEPTKKIVRKGRLDGSQWVDVIETYTYDADEENIWFLMDSVVDGRGNKTVYDIDDSGNRVSETIYEASNFTTPVQQTTYVYGDVDFPSVQTQKTVSGFDGAPDLVTYYTLDDLGRVQLQEVDVAFGGPDDLSKALVTATAYDANSNLIYRVDPNTAALATTADFTDPADIEEHATLAFTYDTRNRLIETKHPATMHPVADEIANPAASEHRVYDKRGNRVGQIDLNGHISVHQYDGLNRKVRTIQVMGAGSSLNPDDAETFRSYSPAANDLVTSMGYNRLNSMVYQTDPEGNTSWLFYDGLQRLTSTLDAAGNSSSFEYDPAFNTGSSAFKRDSFKPTRSLDTRGYETIVEYDPQGLPILQFVQYHKGETPRYSVTAYQYDASGNPTHTTSYLDYTGAPDPTTFRANPPAIDTQITQTDFDTLSRPTKRTRPDGTIETFKYTSTGLLELEQLFRSGTDLADDNPFREQRHYHDGAGRVLASRSLAVAQGQGSVNRVITGQRYDANGNVIEVIDPRNVQYGDIGTDPAEGTDVPDHSNDLNPQTVYDSRNRPVMQIEPRSEDLSRTLVALDGTSMTTPDDTIRPYTLVEYDQVGNPVVQVDAFGHETVTLYDRANRPTHSFTPPVPVLDPFDETQQTTRIAHLVKNHVHDANGNILQTRSGIATPSGLGGLSQYLSPLDAYDASGAVLLPEIAVPTRPTADTSVIWLRTDVTNTYNVLNQLETTTDGEGITVINEYDAAGNRTAMIDGQNQRTEFEYDGLNRNTLMRHHDLSEKTFTFNALTQTLRTDEEEQQTVYTYDDLNRLKTVDYDYDDDGVIDREYFYDPDGNILAVTEAPTDASRMNNVAYAYDAAGRLVKECLGATHAATIGASTVTSGELASGVGSDGITHEYGYDLAGNLTSVRYGNSDRVLLTDYDLLNRAQTITEDTNDNGSYDPDEGDLQTRYVYDFRGAIIEKHTADGLHTRVDVDALSRAQRILGPLDDYGVERYRYDQFYGYSGNVGRIDETYPSVLSKLDDRTIINTYDMADRLTVEKTTSMPAGASAVDVTTTYAYDNAHNRTGKLVTQDDGSSVTTLEDATYTFSNQLNQITQYADEVSGKTVVYTYDDNGARKTRSEGTEETTYGYDFENRLTSLSEVDGATTKAYAYQYDYRTRRTIRDESGAGGQRTYLIYSAGLSVQEWDDVSLDSNNLDTTNDTLTVEYVRGSGLGGGIAGLLYTVRDLDSDGAINDIRLNHYNARGDVVAQTDHLGEVTYQAAYEAFGRHGDTPNSQEWGSTEDRQQANTKDEDPTGLLNEGFRYRDLETGTFITRDPLGFVDGPNVYTYVVQNPWTKFDPLGLRFDDATFDSENNQARSWDQLADDTQKGFADEGATEDSYNKAVTSFNNNLEKLRKTPFGSAQYDYLKNADQKFSFSFGYYDSRGLTGNVAAYFQPKKGNPYGKQGGRGGRFHFNPGKESLGTIAHEFTHGIQDIGSLSLTKWKGDSSILSSLIYSDDSKKRVPGQRTPRWMEAQAQRAKNIVENEHGVMHATKKNLRGNETYGYIKNPHFSPSVDELRNTGTNTYGSDLFFFRELSGSYQYNTPQPDGGPSISNILEARRALTK